MVQAKFVVDGKRLVVVLVGEMVFAIKYWTALSRSAEGAFAQKKEEKTFMQRVITWLRSS